MTDEERQELRDWSARLMPEDILSISCAGIIKVKDYTQSYQNWVDWTPDLPTAPASQILSIIEAMKGLRWWLFWNNEENVAEFYDMDSDHIVRSKGNIFNEAVLLAAKATGVLS